MKIVCIGDSIVNGYPYPRDKSWVSLLANETGLDLVNEGINGDTTYGVLRRFDRDVISKSPDKVIILVGTNDLSIGGAPEEVETNLEQMTKIAQDKGIVPIVLVPLLTDPKKAPELWSESVDYNMLDKDLKTLRDMLLKLDCEVIDLQSLYRGEFIDGEHPDENGYREIYKILLEYI